MASLRPYGLRRQRQLESEIDEEFRFHLEMSAERLRESGLPRHEASLQARRQFGNVRRYRSECLNAHEHAPIRSSIRMGSAMLFLAFGLAALMSLSLLLNAVWFRLPLTFHDTNSWLAVWWEDPVSGSLSSDSSLPDFTSWREADLPLERMTAARYLPMIHDDGKAPQHILAKQVSGGYFRHHGVTPLFGRVFRADEEEGDAKRMVALAHSFWEERLDADPNVVGQQILLDDRHFEVVGVLPKRFRMYYETDVFIPLPFSESLQDNSNRFVVAGRLKEGTTIEDAQAQFQVFQYKQSSERGLTGRERRVKLRPVQEVYADPVKRSMLLASSMVILLLGLSILHFFRNNLRRLRSMPARVASPKRGQSVAWWIVCTLCAIGLTAILLPWLSRFILGGWNRVFDVQVDYRVLVFFLGLLILTAFLVIAPGVQRLKANKAWRLYKLSTAFELALLLTVLVVAGQSALPYFTPDSSIQKFEPDQIYTFSAHLPHFRYKSPRTQAEYYLEAFKQIDEMPQIEQASIVRVLPGDDPITAEFSLTGYPDVPPQYIRCNDVGADFFEIFNTPAITGHTFSELEAPLGRPVVVINKTLADKNWPNKDPIGQRIRPVAANISYEIVGVVDDSHFSTPDEPAAYRLYWQVGGSNMTFTLLASSDHEAMQVRKLVRELDTSVPVGPLESLSERESRLAQNDREFIILIGLAFIVLIAFTIRGIYHFGRETARQLHRDNLSKSMPPTPGSFFPIFKEALHVMAVCIPLGLATALCFNSLVIPEDVLFSPIGPTGWTGIVLIFMVIFAVTFTPTVRRVMGHWVADAPGH